MISALVGHLVGDYLLQNDWMAQNKKTSHLHCAVHCAIWTACVFAAASLGDGLWPLWTVPVLFISHYIQDHTKVINRYMAMMGQTKFAEPPMSPWSIIVVDNVWHIVTLWIVWLVVR